MTKLDAILDDGQQCEQCRAPSARSRFCLVRNVSLCDECWQDVQYCTWCGLPKKDTMPCVEGKGVCIQCHPECPGEYVRSVPQKFTSIERDLQKALDTCKLQHKSQHQPKGIKFIFDEFVPPDILIEANGNRWHSTEKGKEKDARKAKWAEENGYHLIFLWEDEMRKQSALSLVIEKVLPYCGR